MIKKIDKLNTIYNGIIKVDESIQNEIKNNWKEFIKDKNPNDFFDGDIYCATNIDDSKPSINFSKTKYSYMIYAKITKKIIIRSLFSAGYIRTSDNYICIILNNRNELNAIGGMASNEDIKDNKFDYNNCIIREIKEELGINIKNNPNFKLILKYLKYPNNDDLKKTYYPVGTLYEINTKYTKKELISLYNKKEHDSEVKELMFYNNDNYKDIYAYDKKTEYLDELTRILFE